jgi:glutathione S-transferase
MKLYFHPVSTASKPVVLFCADANISYEPHVVDLMKGEHMQDAYLKINPSGLVPAIDDDGFVLTEASAILKYLGEKHNSPAYPKNDVKQRARINERMDFFNTQLYREYGYHLLYPQIFPHHTRKTDEAQKATLEWGREQCKRWVGTLDKIIGHDKYVCGEQISIADYFGAEILAAGDLIGIHFAQYPNVNRWMNTMRQLPNWKKKHEATEGFAQHLKSQNKQFVTL